MGEIATSLVLSHSCPIVHFFIVMPKSQILTSLSRMEISNLMNWTGPFQLRFLSSIFLLKFYLNAES